jgi:hypothetical protein
MGGPILRMKICMRSDFMIDAQEKAFYASPPERNDALIHRSDRGSQLGFKESLELATLEWVSCFNHHHRLLEPSG